MKDLLSTTVKDNKVVNQFTFEDYEKLKPYLLNKYFVNDETREVIWASKELLLSDIYISDITPFQNLTNLEELDLDENQISDISPLKNLTNLKELDLSCNKISDITPLKNLVNLEELFLTHNNITNLTPLKNLVNLKELWLCYNSISDITPLKNLVNLKELWLYVSHGKYSKKQINKLQKCLPNCKLNFD